MSEKRRTRKTSEHLPEAPHMVQEARAVYRVEGAREQATLGLEDLLEQEAMVIVEWGEKLIDQDVNAQVRIHMELLEGEDRRITIEGL